MPGSRSACAALLVAALVFASAPPASARPVAPTKATRINDVDGDGRLDVVFVDPGVAAAVDEGEAGRPGSVVVLFGDGKVQRVTTEQLHDRLFEDSFFGAGLVVGDLNRDGYADVVVSDDQALDYRGRVWALWGSAAGISAARTTVLATGGDSLGLGLAFVPLPEPVLAIGSRSSAKGRVDLYQVRTDGRLGARRRITIGSPGMAGRAFIETGFGSSMSASGDLLVIGAPTAGVRWTAGAAYVLQLQPGLRYWATRLVQGSRHIPGRSEAYDAFGTAVSVLDDQVAIGVPGEGVRGRDAAGAIQFLRVERTGHGLRVHPGRLVTQARRDVAGDLGGNHILGNEVMVTRVCARGYGVVTADHASARLLTTPSVSGQCGGGWLDSAKPDPGATRTPPVSVLRRFEGRTAVDEPVIATGDHSLAIGWPGRSTVIDLTGRTAALVRILAPPAA